MVAPTRDTLGDVIQGLRQLHAKAAFEISERHRTYHQLVIEVIEQYKQILKAAARAGKTEQQAHERLALCLLATCPNSERITLDDTRHFVSLIVAHLESQRENAT